MRPLILTTFLVGHLLRYPSLDVIAYARRIPPIEYPISTRNFGYTTQSLSFPTIMSDLNAQCDKDAERLAKAAESEANILERNTEREEVVKSKKDVEASASPQEEKLPKLSSTEFQIYNSMSEHMEYFHNHFRQTWNMLYGACTNNKRPSSLSLKQFINAGLQFCSHLTTHHGIEEQYIFPMLAAKMPEFKAGPNAAELLRQHKEIHKGLDGFEEYLKKCRSGETELDLKTLKLKMDTWGEVLWKHLDQEVKTLGAENMRKYWTLEEMRRMPM
jgi:hemerythrin-like domain-containing protein